MAEAAGLALSGVALTSLLSTCVEFLEYLENGKNWTKDFQLALTKVSLLKTRLSQWSTSIAMSIGSFEAHVLRERWPEEGGAIMTTLLGIKEIIGSTTQMCRRYDSDKDPPERRWRIDNDTQDGQSCQPHSSFYPFFPKDQFPTSSGSSHSSDLSTDRPRRRQIIRTFRLKVIWALQDKKRFDSLINDFDFLLRNLERIGERLQGDHTAMEGAKADVCHPTDTKILHSMSTSSTSEPALYMESRSSMAVATSNEIRVTMNERTSNLHEPPTEGDGNTIFAEPSQGPQHQLGPRTQGEHLFLYNESYDDSEIFLGDYYSREVPAGAKGHNYVGNRSHGNSTIHAGNTDANSRLQIMREKREARVKAKGRR